MEPNFSIDNSQNEDPEMLEQFQASDIDQTGFRDTVSVLKTPNRFSEPSIGHLRSSELPSDPSLYLSSPDGSVLMIRKANNGRMSPVMGKSVKDYEEKMKILRQENFDLRLYSYNLEQKLRDETRSQSELTIKRYTVQLETEQSKLQEQLAEKNELLKSASAAIESLKSEVDSARRDLELAGSANEQLSKQRAQIEALQKERDTLRRDVEQARYQLAETRFVLEQQHAAAVRPSAPEEGERTGSFDESGSILRNKLSSAEARTYELSQYEDDHLNTTESPKLRSLEQERDNLNQKYERSVKAIQSFIKKVSKRDKEIARLQKKIDGLSARLEASPSPVTEQPIKASTRPQCCCQATQHPSSDQQHEEEEDEKTSEVVLSLRQQVEDLKHSLAEAERLRNTTTENGSLIGDPDPAVLLTETKSLRQSMKQQQEETSALRSRVRHLQQLLDERTGALTMAHSSAAAKAEAIQEKYRHLVEGLEARLEHKEAQLQQLVESLAMRDQVLIESLGAEAATAEHLCRQLEEKEQQLGALFEAKSSMTADLAAARRELARRSEAEKQASRKSLQTVQHECQCLKQELKTAEDAVQRLQDEVQAAREARRVAEDQSRRQVEERDVLIRKLQATISEQESQVSTLTKANVGASPALASFEAMVMEKTARLEESLALREKALQDALHEYRCLASAFAQKEEEVDRVREEGATAAADLTAMVRALERQVEDAEFELSHLREVLHRCEESHVDRLERASVLLEARDRTIDNLLADSRRLSVSQRDAPPNNADRSIIDNLLADSRRLSVSQRDAPPNNEDRSTIALEDLSTSPSAQPRAIADMSVASLHSEVARLRGLLTEKEELIERLGAPNKGVTRRLLTLRRQLTSETAVTPDGDSFVKSTADVDLTTPQLQTLQSQILSLLQTLERTQHLQESFFGDLLTANESLLQQKHHSQSQAQPKNLDVEESPSREAGAPCETSVCLATPSRFADQSMTSLSSLSFLLNRLQGGNVTLDGATMTEEMHEMIFERLREQVEQLRSALTACSEQGLALMQEAALCASAGAPPFLIDSEDWAALLRRLLGRLEKTEEGQENEAMHRDIRLAVGLCRQIVDRLDCWMSEDHKVSPVNNRSLTASQLKSTYNNKISGTFSVGSLSPINLDDSELEPEDLSKTLNMRTRCAALESQLRATRERATSLEAENKVLRIRLDGRTRQDGAVGSSQASPERPLSVAKTNTDSGHVEGFGGSGVNSRSGSGSSFCIQRGIDQDAHLLQDIVDLERERSALESELSRVRDLCASGHEDSQPQRSFLDSRIDEVTEQLRTMRLDLSMRLQDQSALQDSDLGSRHSTSLGSRKRSSLAVRSPKTGGKECEELRQLVVDLRRQLADRQELSELSQRLSMMRSDLDMEHERVEELTRERDRLLVDRVELAKAKERLQDDLSVARDSNARLRHDYTELTEQLRLRESTDSDRLAIEERIVSIRAQMAELEAENTTVRGRAEQAEAEAGRMGRACASLTEEADRLKQRLTELAEAEAEKGERLAAKAAEEQRLTIALVNAEDELEAVHRQKEELERRALSLESALKAEVMQRGRLEEQLGTAREEKTRLVAKLEAVREEQKQLGALLDSKEDEKEALREEKAQLGEEKAKLSAEVRLVTEERARLSAALSDVSEEKSRLGAELAQVSEERVRLHRELSQMCEEKAKVGAELAQIAEDRLAVRTELDKASEERQQLAARLEEKATNMRALEEDLRRAGAVVEEQEARMAALEEEKGASDARRTEVERRWKATREDLQRVEARVGALEEENAQLLAELDALEQQMGELRADKERLQREAKEQKSGNLDLRSELEKARRENEQLQKEADQLERQMEDVRTEKERFQREVEEKTTGNRKMLMELDELERQMEEMQREKEQFQREAEEQMTGNRELRSENSSLKFKVQELQNTLNGWREAMDELERRLEDRSASMERLSLQLAELSQLREVAEQRSAALEGEVDFLRSSRGDWDATQEENRSLHVSKAELERRLQTMTEVLRQREETIEELKKESAEYHSQVQRFSPEIRNLQSNLASVNSHRSEMRACLERLHSRIHNSMAEHKARLNAHGIDMSFEVDRDDSRKSTSEESLDLPVVETELHRALDQIQHLQEELARTDAALRGRTEDLEEARAQTAELERAKERLEQSQSALRDGALRRDREAMPSAAELRETGEMIRVLESRVRDLLAEKDKWKAAAKELRSKLDTRTSRLEACVKQNARLKALIKQDEQQAEDRRLDLEKLTISVEGKNDTISRLQRQLKAMQRELESSRPRAAGQNNSNANVSDNSEQSDASDVAPPNNASFSIGSRSSTSSTVTSVQSSRESVRAAATATPVGPMAPLTPALSDVTGSSQAALSSSRAGDKGAMELLSLQAKLRATENLNKSLRAELSLAEVHIQAIKSTRVPSTGNSASFVEQPSVYHSFRASAMKDSLVLDASMSPVKSPVFDHCLRTYIEEIRSLRESLEASITENDHLREALQKQLLEQKNSQKSPSLFEKEVRRLRERLVNKKRRVVELEAELVGVRARTDSSERENVVLHSELQATKDLLATCQGELDLLTAKKAAGGRREMLRETQRLRVQLERSLESNRRLHDQLKQQLAREPSTVRGDFSNCSTPKSTARPDAMGDIMSDVSAVTATPGSAGEITRHLDSGLRRCDSESRLGSKSHSRPRFTSTDPLRIDSDFRLLYAISRLDDYELLRKEIQETLCLVRSMRSRINDRVRHYKSEPLQESLDYSTLKELQSEVSSLVYFLEQENALIGRFWTAELPPRDQPSHCRDPSSHVQLIESQLEVERLRTSNRLLRQLLDQNERRLVATDRAKTDMESVLVERLSNTEHVLSTARGTLERCTTSSLQDQLSSGNRHDP